MGVQAKMQLLHARELTAGLRVLNSVKDTDTAGARIPDSAR